MELTIDRVSKRFKDKSAVDDVSLTLTPGVCGVVGFRAKAPWGV